MTRQEITMWDCLCLNSVPFDTEVCPECGRNRDFVLAKQASARHSAEEVAPAAVGKVDHSGNDQKGESKSPEPDGPTVQVEEPVGSKGSMPPQPEGRKWRRWLSRLGWERNVRLARWAMTIAILLALYWVTTSVANYLRQPKLQMLQSPIAGALAVAVEAVKREAIASKVTYTGTISPLQEVRVYPRVQGWVQNFTLYEGHQVEKGQIIARLDGAELRAAVAQARERVAAGEQHRSQLEANLGIHRASILEAEAALEEAGANLIFWKKELQRTETLFKRNAISESELDNARKQLAAAKGKRDTRRARIQSHRARLQVAKRELERIAAMLKSRRAELSRRSTVLGYTNILAPITGVVAKRHIYSGVLVKPGSPIVDIADISKVRIQIRVAEKDIPRVKVGTTAVVRVPSLPNPHNVFETKVSTLFPKLDPVSRTSTVEMILDNPGGRLKPDMFAVVDLIAESREKALTAPRRAVLEVEGKPTVFIVEGEEAVAKLVKLGLVSGDRIEILEGVQKGDLVVYEGNRGLVDGQEVSVVSRR